MDPKTVQANLKKIAFSSAIVQGLVYTILALICVILHNEKTARIFEPLSYMEQFAAGLYYWYLTPDYQIVGGPDFTLTPDVFTGFAWVYFFLNVFWLIASVFALRKIDTVLYLEVWSYLSFAICFWDFITVVVFGVDHKKCLEWSKSNINYEALCTTQIIPVLVIAAKGFVLFFINLIFAVIVKKIASAKQTAARSQPILVQSSTQPGPSSFQPNAYNTQPNFYSPQPGPFRNQPGPYSAQPTPYPPPPPQPPQNFQRNNHPVYIPEPDYHNEYTGRK